MAVLNLEMGPEEAVSVLNGHDHASGVGKPISTEGLADKAVTRNKLTEKVIGSEQLDDQSIGTTHIQQGAITKELLAAGLLNQELSSKVLGQKNFIVSGMDIQVDLMNGAPLLKNPGGKVNLAEQYIDVAASTIPLTATPSSGMVYCQKEISKEVCVRTVQFKWPVLDNMVVHHYEFDDTGTVVNDKTANQNNLIAGGTKADEVERVAGSLGYGRKISVNSNLLSQGNVCDFNQTKKIAILADFIYKDYKSTTTANFMIASLNGFYFRVYNSTGELYLHYCGWSGAEFSLNYFLRPGMRYQIVLAYDNEQLIIYINGVVWWKAKLQNAAMPTVSKLGVLNHYDGNYRADKSIMNFLQIRKDVLSAEEWAKLATQTGIPCEYIDYMATTPDLSSETEEWHEWRFDECSGNLANDTSSVGTLYPGTAQNCPIITSTVGLGYARRFTGVGAISRLDIGNFKFPASFGFFALLEARALDSYRTLFSNYNGSKGNILYVSYNGSRCIGAYASGTGTTGGGVAATIQIPDNAPAVVGFVFADGGLYLYSDRTEPEFIPNFTANAVDNLAACFGVYPNNNSYPFVGDLHHVVMLYRKPSEAEIKNVFSCLKRRTYRNIANDILPTDAISLGNFQNDGQKAKFDSSPCWGVKSNPFCVPRSKFMGWQWVTTSNNYYWENPFRSQRIKVTLFYKRYMWDNAYSVVDSMYNSSNGYAYGCYINQICNEYIRVYTGQASVIWNQLSPKDNDGSVGWYGCLVEAIDDVMVQTSEFRA